MAHIATEEVTGKQITIADVPTPEEIELSAALELVKNDAQSAQAWIESNQWNENWRQIDILYDSPKVFSSWDGTVQQKPSINRYTLAQHVNSIHPTLIEGLFYNDECFEAEPRPGTEAEVVRARSTVMKVQLDQMEFQNEVSLGLFQTILHGTGIYKWGLRTVEEEYYTYEQKGQPLSQVNSLGGTVTTDTKASLSWKEVSHKRKVIKPFFENRERRNILVDPKLKLPDIRYANFVIDKYYLTLADILDLKNDPNYEYLTETDDEIKAWFETPKEEPAQLGNLDTTPGSPAIAGQGVPDWMQTSDDPYEQGLMCLERWDNHKVITVLNNKKVIQNQKNIYGCLPFYSSNWYNRIKAFDGLGVGKMVGTDQRLQQGLENAGLELLQLIMDPPFAVSDDANVPSQNVRFRKGGFIKIKGDVRAGIAPLEMPRLPLGEVFAFMQNSSSKSEAASGAGELFSQGMLPGPASGKSSATRNATGAAGVISAQAGRMQGPLEHFISQVFVPWVYQLDTLNRRFIMTTPEGSSMFRDILSDELGKDFKFDESGFLSGRVKFGVKAGAHLASRKLAAQMLPVVTQIFDNPQIQQQLNQINEEYVDIKELLLLWLETIGLHNRKSLIKKMTPEMKANQKAQGEAAKVQAQMALDDHKAGNKSELQAQKTKEGIARDVINRSLDQGGDYLLRKEFEDSPGQLGSEQ
jgi:hypothetical protein